MLHMIRSILCDQYIFQYISQRSKKGIKTVENQHDLDIIVYATGFLLKENYDFITKLGLSERPLEREVDMISTKS